MPSGTFMYRLVIFYLNIFFQKNTKFGFIKSHTINLDKKFKNLKKKFNPGRYGLRIAGYTLAGTDQEREFHSQDVRTMKELREISVSEQ